MKKHTIKSLLALLLALCLLLGSVAALAEEATPVEGKTDDDGNYTADVGKVEGSGGAGVSVNVDSYSPPTVQADGKDIAPQPVEVKSITVNAESVKEETVEKDSSTGGIVVANSSQERTNVTVNVTKDESVAGSGDVTVSGKENVIGIITETSDTSRQSVSLSNADQADTSDESVKVSTDVNVGGNVTVTSDSFAVGIGTNLGNGQNYNDNGLSSNDGDLLSPESGITTQTSINVGGDLTVTGGDTAVGVAASAEKGGTANVDIGGGVTVKSVPNDEYFNISNFTVGVATNSDDYPTQWIWNNLYDSTLPFNDSSFLPTGTDQINRTVDVTVHDAIDVTNESDYTPTIGIAANASIMDSVSVTAGDSANASSGGGNVTVNGSNLTAGIVAQAYNAVLDSQPGMLVENPDELQQTFIGNGNVIQVGNVEVTQKTADESSSQTDDLALAYGITARAYLLGNNAITAGDVSVDGAGYAFGVKSNQEEIPIANVIGSGDLYSFLALLNFDYMEENKIGGANNIETDSVDVTGKYGATGILAKTWIFGENNITVAGDVNASTSNPPENDGLLSQMLRTDLDSSTYGILAQYVTLPDTSSGENTGYGAINIDVIGDEDAGKEGDVTSSGIGVGVFVNPYSARPQLGQRYDAALADGNEDVIQQEDEADDEKPTVDIFVNGTVSGMERAIEFLATTVYNDDDTFKGFDLGKARITLWAANTDGDTESVAQIVTEWGDIITDTGDYKSAYPENDPDANTLAVAKKAASEALTNAIFYIAKVGETGTGKIAVTGTSQYKINEEDKDSYELAHEEEDVKLKLSLADGDELEGVYYDDEDESSLITLSNLGDKDQDGNYLVKMLRGGAMRLGLKLHADGETVEEAGKAPSCTEDGYHYVVTYCKYHKTEERSRTKVTDKATGHTPGAAVRENEVAPQIGVAGSYDLVTRCKTCKAILDSEHVVTDPLPEPEPDPDPEPENKSDPNKKVPNKRYVLVYVPVPGDELVRGLKGDDKTSAAQVFKALADDLSGGNGGNSGNSGNGSDGGNAVPVVVTILGIEKILTPEELTAFNALPLDEQLALALAIASDRTTLREAAEKAELSDDAKALADTVATRFEGMKPDELAKLDAIIAQEFPMTTTVMDGQDSSSVPLRLKIAQGDKVDYEQYTFTNTNGEWKLSSIAKGVWKLVED